MFLKFFSHKLKCQIPTCKWTKPCAKGYIGQVGDDRFMCNFTFRINMFLPLLYIKNKNLQKFMSR